jgi:hypothetical protein
VSQALTTIVALARAGATGEALRRLDEGEFGEEFRAAAVRGRLLKDLAQRAEGAERRRLYGEAAAAYLRSAAIVPATYPLINAASLSLLAGDAAAAAEAARQVLARIEADPGEPETPYWRAATRAEALLLLDRRDEPRAALAEAVALAPQAWEDHAATLRQFRLILGEQGRDAAWLDAYRPPRSLHFGGHMSFDARVARREHLEERIVALLDEERIGFGFGALAAGADIIVAEALAARGAELHIVLPGGVAAFASISVDPLGRGWRRRFDALIAIAASVRAIRPVGRAPDRETIALADEVVLGMAMLNARTLETGAVQLMVAAAPHDGGAFAPPPGGVRQRVVVAPREALSSEPPPLGAGSGALLALLAIALPQDDHEAALAAVATTLAEAPLALPPWFTGREIVAAFTRPSSILPVAGRLGTIGNVSMGAHYGVSERVADPFAGISRPAGEALRLASGAAASAPVGTLCVTADFAAALVAGGGGSASPALVGELETPDGPIELFALDHFPFEATGSDDN